MKVIFFTKYTRKGASSRLRTYQYIDYFQKAGITIKVSPLFSDAYLEQVYAYRHHNKWLAFKSFVSRFLAILSVGAYDLVVIEKELFPYFPSIFERLLKWFDIPVIVDYDDAIFHNYDLSPNPIIRFILKNKIRNVMRFSTCVVAGNSYLYEKAKLSGARKALIIPTVIDLDRYTPKEYSTPSDVFTIGWIGSPITFKYLHALKPAFEHLASCYKISIKLIGSGKGLGLGPTEQVLEWKESDETKDIQTFDVGIMPLEDNVWERGKCGYKLIQYMGCAIPVIGTPIGVNDILIQDGFNGFKARTTDDWIESITRLIQDFELRKKLGSNGRQFVEGNYTLQRQQKNWIAVLRQQARTP